jgi:hypothetical protein
LAHSHLLVKHLLKQLEHHKRDRHRRRRRPDWLVAFVHQVSALFEPLKGAGRVGSQCEYTDQGWEARLYLGSTEVVGGKNDGHFQLVSFEFDFLRLQETLTRLVDFHWTVAAADGVNSSFVSLRGYVDEHPVCLKIYSRPPADAGPAFRQNADGSVETVT